MADFREIVMDGHGGDDIIVNALYDILSDKIEPETHLSESLEYHLIGIAAEESRKLGGALVKVHMQ